LKRRSECEATGTTKDMLTLYATPISANGRKVLALVQQLGLSVLIKTVNVYEGEGKALAYRALNPSGKVPTLVDDDFVLTESNAILVYLSEAYGDFSLSSRSHTRRADILRWLFWESSHFQPVLTRFLAPRVRQILFPDSKARPPETEWEHPELTPVLDQLESALSGRDFICGNEICIADFSIAGMTTYFHSTMFPSDGYPAISAWCARMDRLPAWASTAAQPWI
jgi:glutathione S-transferase